MVFHDRSQSSEARDESCMASDESRMARDVSRMARDESRMAPDESCMAANYCHPDKSIHRCVRTHSHLYSYIYVAKSFGVTVTEICYGREHGTTICY
jgi:hypothetical protein